MSYSLEMALLTKTFAMTSGKKSAKRNICFLSVSTVSCCLTSCKRVSYLTHLSRNSPCFFALLVAGRFDAMTALVSLYDLNWPRLFGGV